MLIHPTLAKLEALRLYGMARALNDQLQQPDCATLTFEERLGLLVDRELTDRQNDKLAARLKRARLRQPATPENVDFRHARGLDRAQFLALGSGQWIHDREHLIITGPTGVGKTYLACAWGQKACREGYTVEYARASALLQDLTYAEADGTYRKRLAALAKVDLLILDDWGLQAPSPAQRHYLWELFDDRYETRSLLITSQFPVAHWHEALGEPTAADAILDRVVHAAHQLNLTGESLRKQRPNR